MRMGTRERVKFYIDAPNEKMLSTIKTVYDISYSDAVNFVLNYLNQKLVTNEIDIFKLHIKKGK